LRNLVEEIYHYNIRQRKVYGRRDTADLVGIRRVHIRIQVADDAIDCGGGIGGRAAILLIDQKRSPAMAAATNRAGG
jgi:hypothetical protein